MPRAGTLRDRHCFLCFPKLRSAHQTSSTARWFHKHRCAWQPSKNRMERTMKSKSIIPNPFTLASVTCLALAAVLAGVAGCATTRQSPLRVGITPDYPPLVFEKDDGVAGAEIDLADALGAQLGRPVQCFPMRWEQLIPALQEEIGRAS